MRSSLVTAGVAVVSDKSFIESSRILGIALTGRGNVVIENVTFQYGNETSMVVIDDVSLKIPAGETIAFVVKAAPARRRSPTL